MANLVPLMVKIKLHNTGHAKYPDFNRLNCVQATGMDWANYVDNEGQGWCYDKVSGHKDDTPDSPRGQQWGMLIVPAVFVDEAVTAFPDECREMTETEAEEFYESKVSVNEPDEDIAIDVLQALKLKQDLGITLTSRQLEALDPEKPERGIVRNPRKTWASFKNSKGFEIGR